MKRADALRQARDAAQKGGIRDCYQRPPGFYIPTMKRLLSHSLLLVLTACGLATARAEKEPKAHAQAAEALFNPGSITSTGEAVTAATPLKPGDVLQVEWGKTWWAAKVVSLEPDQQVKIHYIGWADFHDEVVPRSRLQLDPQAEAKALLRKNLRGVNASGETIYNPGSIASTGNAVTATTALKKGDILQVEQSGVWWAAEVVALEADQQVRIHYIGWADDWDELVPRSRLQIDPEADAKARATRGGK
jgi:ribosomal 50S subunit-recycling heat shock protein